MNTPQVRPTKVAMEITPCESFLIRLLREQSHAEIHSSLSTLFELVLNSPRGLTEAQKNSLHRVEMVRAAFRSYKEYEIEEG